MGTVDEIKIKVSRLSKKEFAGFREWFEEFEEKAWDKQLEKDVGKGRLDKLAKEAEEEFKTGRCSDL